MDIGADDVFGSMDALASWTGGGGGGRGSIAHTSNPLLMPWSNHDHERTRQARRIHTVLEQTGRAMVKTATLGEPTMPFAEYARGSGRRSTPSSSHQ